MNNGSEIFFSVAGRSWKTGNKNILEFCSMLQMINYKQSLELTQWTYLYQSTRQLRVEAAIFRNLKTLEMEKQHLPLNVCLKNFLYNTKYVTAHVSQFFERKQKETGTTEVEPLNMI